MQQELIEMLEETIQYVEVWNAHDQGIIDKAEALVEKAKKSAKEPAVPRGEPVPMSESQRADMVCAVAAICTGTSSRTVAATAIEWVERYYGISAPSQPVMKNPDVATWLWLRFADYCRKQGMNPHHQNDLFAIVNELRAMLASTTPPVHAAAQEPVTLTDEEILSEAAGHCWSEDGVDPLLFARAIIASLREKEQA